MNRRDFFGIGAKAAVGASAASVAIAECDDGFDFCEADPALGISTVEVEPNPELVRHVVQFGPDTLYVTDKGVFSVGYDESSRLMMKFTKT